MVKQRTLRPELPVHGAVPNVVHGIQLPVGRQYPGKPGGGQDASGDLPPAGRGDEGWLLSIRQPVTDGNAALFHPHAHPGHLQHPVSPLSVGGDGDQRSFLREQLPALLQHRDDAVPALGQIPILRQRSEGIGHGDPVPGVLRIEEGQAVGVGHDVQQDQMPDQSQLVFMQLHVYLLSWC